MRKFPYIGVNIQKAMRFGGADQPLVTPALYVFGWETL